jgi:hypothetical protein
MLWHEKQLVVAKSISKVHTKSHDLLALKENCPGCQNIRNATLCWFHAM